MFCCLRTCLNGNTRKPTHRTTREPEIRLDALNMGPDVILLSNQLRITGTGGALATAPLMQSKSYFEIKIQQSGCWSVGVATREADLTKKVGGTDKESWCLCSDNATRHNNDEEGSRPVVVTTVEPSVTATNGIDEAVLLRTTTPSPADETPDDAAVGTVDLSSPAETVKRTFPDEGDIVGVAFDHVELNFYFNGKNLDVPIRNVKSAVFPVVYVGSGAILDIVLDNFHYGPPPGFDRIMLEQSLL